MRRYIGWLISVAAVAGAVAAVVLWEPVITAVCFPLFILGILIGGDL